MGFPWGAAASLAGGLLGSSKKRSSGGGGRARSFYLSGNPMFDISHSRVRGPDRFRLGFKGPMKTLFNQFSDRAMFMPDWLDDADEMLSTQGMDMLGSLATTPEDVMMQQYGLIAPMLEDSFLNDRLAMENRQFAQGRLGSTGGANEFGELFESQGNTRARAMFDAFGQGLQTQNQMFNIGSGMLQLNPALRNAFQTMASNNLNNILNMNNAMLETARVGGGLNGAGVGGGSSTAGGFNAGQAIASGLIKSGTEGLTNWLDTLNT